MKKHLSAAMALIIATVMLFPLLTLGTSAADRPKSMLVLGDSISTGYGLADYTPADPYKCASYANTVAAHLGLKAGETYLNKSVNGDKSADLLALLPGLKNELAAAELIVITIGGNDLLHTLPLVASTISGTAVTDFAGSIPIIAGATPEQIDSLATNKEFTQQLTSIVLNCSLNLVQCATLLKESAPNAQIVFLKQYNPMRNVPGIEAFGAYAQDIIDQINRSIETVCQTNEFVCLDAPSVIDSNAVGLTNISSMDIHPNAQGHALLAKLVTDYLDSLEAEDTTAVPETTPAPETTKTPETTPAPESTDTPDTNECPDLTTPENTADNGKDDEGCASLAHATALVVIIGGALAIAKRKK